MLLNTCFVNDKNTNDNIYIYVTAWLTSVWGASSAKIISSLLLGTVKLLLAIAFEYYA